MVKDVTDGAPSVALVAIKPFGLQIATVYFSSLPKVSGGYQIRQKAHVHHLLPVLFIGTKGWPVHRIGFFKTVQSLQYALARYHSMNPAKVTASNTR
ncbi:uncharacterized protein LAESUDRAFT_732720 [Laetiporus sulphureus 93-53]|uniref:Uncharacterized protein n=1 Tax=Laetiporus sulphureus 93-53 TaxID=1314785 RepID=A0A165AZX5_9APHY|nr:uncharacterized protein LAESUDRAFT_732720 [Laetiporus sulphureus 93-53]KZS99967.1 hypothetical protein LAESUDRAFT_732720 [Laetiporus sulphureus 93-53]